MQIRNSCNNFFKNIKKQICAIKSFDIKFKNIQMKYKETSYHYKICINIRSYYYTFVQFWERRFIKIYIKLLNDVYRN